jgi:hypothetical protein
VQRWFTPRFALLALVWSLVLAAPAADVTIDDLRLEYSPLLGRNFHEYGQLDDESASAGISQHGNTSFTQTLPSHRRVGLGYYHSLSPLEADHGSFVLGLAGGYDRVQTLGGAVGRSLVLDAFAGFAWAFTPSWHLEEGFLLGGGRTEWSAHFPHWYFDGADWTDDTYAWMYEYGLRLGTTYTWQHLQAVIDARYLFSSMHLTLHGTHTNGSASEDVSFHPRITIEGIGGMVGLGWRF